MRSHHPLLPHFPSLFFPITIAIPNTQYAFKMRICHNAPAAVRGEASRGEAPHQIRQKLMAMHMAWYMRIYTTVIVCLPVSGVCDECERRNGSLDKVQQRVLTAAPPA